MKTAWKIAESWYKQDQVKRSLLFRGVRHETRLGDDAVPEDVRSPEFAKWLTNQYRLAMAKGIEIGRREA